MGQFDDIIGTPKKSIKKEKKKSEVKCRKCRKYRQFVRCYDCGKTEVVVDSDIIVGEPLEDVINVVPKKITTAYNISLPIIRNISPIPIWDEIMTLDELIKEMDKE